MHTLQCYGAPIACGACHTIIMSTMGDLRETFSEINFAF